VKIRVVYHASRGVDLTKAAEVLKAAGCNPVTPDDPNPPAGPGYDSGGSLKIRVAVPEEEEQAARTALEEWIRERGGEEERQARGRRTQTIVVLLVLGLGMVVVWVIGVF
jgi:hypothetical protein